MRARFGTRLVAVYKDKGSGLRESRRGLERVLKDAEEGRFEVLAVTHADRLARFGTTWLERLLSRDGVKIEVLHENGAAGGMPELLEDFMSPVTTFTGRMYGIFSAEAKLAAQAGERRGGMSTSLVTCWSAPPPAAATGRRKQRMGGSSRSLNWRSAHAG